MSKIHKTLLRQLKKSGLIELVEEEKWKLLFQNITLSYEDYEQQIDRFNNTLDVSLRKSFQLSKKIEENAKNDFKLLIEGLPGLISWFDEDLNYLGVNENFIHFNNRPREDYIGKKLGSINKEKDSKLLSDFNFFAKSSLLKAQSDYSITVKGETHFVNSHFQKIDNGKIIIIASIDLTERMKLQSMVNQQAEVSMKNSKLAAIGEMAAGVAHEINNPLTVVLGCSKQIIILLDQLKTKNDQIIDPEEIRNRAEKIHRMSVRMSKIVSNLKHLSRDGSNDPYVQVSFKEVFSCAIELNQEKIITNNISFSIEGNQETILWAQPVSLSQVFLNLIINSIDAVCDTPNAWIKCQIDIKQTTTTIKIIDSGKGIPNEIHDKIFQPFYTSKEVGKGTGLGLSISKGIIKSHNGEFFIDNENPNTCFTIVLPNKELKLKIAS